MRIMHDVFSLCMMHCLILVICVENQGRLEGGPGDTFQGRAQKFKKGGPKLSVFVFTENIGEDQKKRSSRRLTSNLYLKIG